MTRSMLVLAATMLLIPPQCAGSTPTPSPPLPPAHGDDCDQAQERLLQLGCREGQPTTKGTPFAQVCRDTIDAGVRLHPECIKVVASCSEVSKC